MVSAKINCNAKTMIRLFHVSLSTFASNDPDRTVIIQSLTRKNCRIFIFVNDDASMENC